MENHYAAIISDGKSIAENQELIRAIRVVSPEAGAPVKSFTDERENIIDQKITGG